MILILLLIMDANCSLVGHVFRPPKKNGFQVSQLAEILDWLIL